MITADFEFTISLKNKEILVVEGHEFHVKRLNKFTTAWNCSKYQSYKCRVSALTQDDQLIRVNGEHNHSASIGKPTTREVIKDIKALSENLTHAAAVASAILPVTDVLSTQYALPSIPNLIQTSQRLRQVIQTVSIHEPSDRHFDITDKFQEFLRYDSGKDDHERILVFGDPYMTSVLKSSKFWLGVGTFKLSLKNFYQMYTLHVYVLGIAPACLYALLPNKTEKTYSRLLVALDTFAPGYKPDTILLDFEIAPIIAFQKHHPASRFLG